MYTPNIFIYWVPTNPVINEAQEAKDMLGELKYLSSLASTHIRDRKVYRDAFIEGRGVVEMNNPKATQELTQLYKEIFQ